MSSAEDPAAALAVDGGWWKVGGVPGMEGHPHHSWWLSFNPSEKICASQNG